MEYRRAHRSDLDLFAAHRMDFVSSIRKISDIEGFRAKTKQYIEEHIDKDDLLIWIAVDEGKIAASCMACIYQTAPLPSCPNGKKAELLNVYTLAEYRKQGHAEKLLRMLIQALKERGVEKILLDSTDMGLPLYQKLGFVQLESQMELKL